MRAASSWWVMRPVKVPEDASHGTSAQGGGKGTGVDGWVDG
jgi:hypothetical protein